jgi:hypothetical protein
MALGDSLLVVAVALVLVQLFGGWVVLEAEEHLLVMEHLLLQPKGLQIQAAAAVREQVM